MPMVRSPLVKGIPMPLTNITPKLMGITMDFKATLTFFCRLTYEARSKLWAASLIARTALRKSASETALSSEAGRVTEYVLLLPRRSSLARCRPSSCS